MESHNHGLAADLATMLKMGADRRQSLRWLLAGAATLPVFGCGGSSTDDASTTTTTTTATPTTTTSTACTVIPEETGGPYPADGTNSNSGGVVNALTLSGIVRSDIRASIAGASGVAAGVPVKFRLLVQNAGAALANCAVYLWHCDRDGLYSLYSSGVTGENYLRGVQQADASGNIEFTSIFPGCYAGRMPHVHFEVYPSLAQSTSAANRIKTSQFTFPLATLNEVYASSGYSSSVRNLAAITYATDNVFSDGTSLQMTSVTGNASDGYIVTLTLAVSA